MGAVDLDGKPILCGKTVTGFSNAEEEAVSRTKVMISVCCCCHLRHSTI